MAGACHFRGGGLGVSLVVGGGFEEGGAAAVVGAGRAGGDGLGHEGEVSPSREAYEEIGGGRRRAFAFSASHFYQFFIF